ncbi:MAG: MFS transporter, partial [Candidatus Latescibacterota bacterium]|nr:MFS transporter [Candidatus Latescibacterota bacterium]
LFNPPAAGQSVATFLYLLFSFLLLNTSMTLVAVPHAALAGELSSDRHERSALFGFKRLFATLGALLGLVLPALVLAYWGEPNDPVTMARARSAASGLLAPAIIGTAWLSYRLTRGLDRSARERTRWRLDLLVHLVLEQREALKNPLFRLLVIAFIIAAVGRTLNASIALYYYEYFLQLGEQDAVVWVLLPFFLSFIASVPMWIFLGKRWGKKRAALLGVLSLGVTTAVVYPLMPAGQIVFPLAYSLVGGVMAGAIVLMDALVADSIDYDRIRVRRAREGLYFGVWKMSTKVARALGLLLAGVLLDLIGFAEGGGAVSAEVSFRLAFLFGPAVGVLFVMAGVILWFLPLDNALHDRIQRIAQRRWER